MSAHLTDVFAIYDHDGTLHLLGPSDVIPKGARLLITHAELRHITYPFRACAPGAYFGPGKAIYKGDELLARLHNSLAARVSRETGHRITGDELRFLRNVLGAEWESPRRCIGFRNRFCSKTLEPVAVSCLTKGFLVQIAKDLYVATTVGQQLAGVPAHMIRKPPHK